MINANTFKRTVRRVYLQAHKAIESSRSNSSVPGRAILFYAVGVHLMRQAMMRMGILYGDQKASLQCLADVFRVLSKDDDSKEAKAMADAAKKAFAKLERVF